VDEASHSDFIRSFENGAFPIASWTHAAHIAMGAWYLLSLPAEDAATKIREGIPRYNVAQGNQNTDESGYHETLTIFWIAIIRDALARLDTGMSNVEKVRAMVDEYGGRARLHQDYYSFDVVRSVQARRAWIPPDRLSLTR
jgi:hypothetical protein